MRKLWVKLIAGAVAASYCSFAQAQDVVTDEVLASADVAKGKIVSLRCRACHTFGEGQPNMLGPNLYHIFHRHVGEKADFKYSQALKEADFLWTPDRLNEWLMGPRDFVPGNAMNFVGLPREADRINLIAYLIGETGGLPSNGGDDAGATAADDGGSDTTEAQPGTEETPAEGAQ